MGNLKGFGSCPSEGKSVSSSFEENKANILSNLLKNTKGLGAKSRFDSQNYKVVKKPGAGQKRDGIGHKLSANSGLLKKNSKYNTEKCPFGTDRGIFRGGNKFDFSDPNRGK